MKFRKFAATSALVIAALGISTGTSFASPAPAPAANPDIHYTANAVGKTVVVKTDAGSLTTEGSQLQFRDSQGKVVAGFPLSYVHDGLQFPIAAQIDGNNQATLVPSTDPATAHPVQVQNVASRSDLDAAMQSAINELGMATSIGTIVGTAIGLVGGCVLGAALGTPFLVVPGWIGGCLTGAALGAPLGAAAGLVAVGGTAGLAVAVEYFNRINNPPAS